MQMLRLEGDAIGWADVQTAAATAREAGAPSVDSRGTAYHVVHLTGAQEQSLLSDPAYREALRSGAERWGRHDVPILKNACAVLHGIAIVIDSSLR